MYNTVDELSKQAKKSSLYDVILNAEIQESGDSKTLVLRRMSAQLEVMRKTVAQGIEGVTSPTGLSGLDAKKLDEFMLSGPFLSSPFVLKAVRNAIATNEVNAAMGIICATPTAGSAGVLPGVLMALVEQFDISLDQQLEFLFVAGGFGLVIANNASISGAEGGCQAEIGSASAMCAAALCNFSGGSPEQCAHACAMVIKNMLGLICDPVAGLVEVPCVKRNALGATQAIIASDMALAGIQSRIPVDEVIETMYRVGLEMPSKFRETGKGGLAASAHAQELTAQIFGD